MTCTQFFSVIFLVFFIVVALETRLGASKGHPPIREPHLRGIASGMVFVRVVVLLAVVNCAASGLGGKSFLAARQDFTGKDYAAIALCDDLPTKGVGINVTLLLKNDEGGEQAVHFRQGKEAILINSAMTSNLTEILLTAEASPIAFSVQKVTIRLGDVLYKLHVNQECDDDAAFATSPTASTFWSRRVDCERKDVYCDDRRDEFIGCENLFVYHMMWRRGATGRHGAV